MPLQQIPEIPSGLPVLEDHQQRNHRKRHSVLQDRARTSAADDLQVREAPRVSPGFAAVAYKTTSLLWPGARQTTMQRLCERGGTAMPLTQEQFEKSLDDPALCEQLPVRDYLDNVMVRTSGALVAGYQLRGLTSYFASDEDRDRGKVMLGALLKAIPEQSMRVQIRYEVVENVGNLLENYRAQDRSSNEVAQALDAARFEAWRERAENGEYQRPLVHLYFIWDPRLHHKVTGKQNKRRTWGFTGRF